MVYNPYQKTQTGMGYSGRRISTTRPNIKNEEDEMKKSSPPPASGINNAAKNMAAKKVLANPVPVPDVMPTVGPIAGTGTTKMANPYGNTIMSNNPPEEESDPLEEREAAEQQAQRDAQRNDAQRQEAERRKSWLLDKLQNGTEDEKDQAYFELYGEHRDPRRREGASEYDFIDEETLAKYDWNNNGVIDGSEGSTADERHPKHDDYDPNWKDNDPNWGGSEDDGDGGDGDGGDGGDGGDEGDTAKDKLIKLIMEKLSESPEERASIEAGRAIGAARAQAGRGQMGMSGGMLALQSDVQGEASRKAEDFLFGQQLAAGKLGAGMEAEQRNLLIQIIAAKEDLNMTDTEFGNFLRTMGFTQADVDEMTGEGSEGGFAGSDVGDTDREITYASTFDTSETITSTLRELLDLIIAQHLEATGETLSDDEAYKKAEEEVLGFNDPANDDDDDE